MTYINEEWFEIFSYFEKTSLQISMDGVGPAIEYIRDGTIWAEMKANIQLSIEKLENAQFIFVPCVNAYSLPNLVEVYKYVEKLKAQFANKSIEIYPNLLVSPAHLSVSLLGLKHRQVIGGNLSELLERDFLTVAEKTNLRALIKQVLDLPVMGESLRGHWKTFTQTLDVQRNQSLKDSLPELAVYLESD